MSGVKPTNERPPRRVQATESVAATVDGENMDWEPAAGSGDGELDQWKQPVVAATTGNITIATGLNVGDTIDGVTLADGDRVLVKNQTASEENGIYLAGTTPERAPDMDEDDEVLGAVVYVIDGTTNGGTAWACDLTSEPVVDTDPITFAAFGGGGGSALTIKDEGTPLATTASSLDFVGSGVTASGTGAAKTVTIPGGTTLSWFIVTAAAYGATGDGTTDDTTAINLAIAALNAATRGVLYFPAGQYKVTSALTTITATGTIMGDGIEASKIAFTSATAVLFTLTGAGIIVRGLWLNNSATTTAGAAISVTSGGNLNRYEDVLFHGFWIGLDIQSGAEWLARGLYMESVNKYGVKVSGNDPDWGITDSTFSTASSADAAIRIQSTSDGGGGRITGCKINGDTTNGFNYGVDLAAQTGTDTVILLVANCSIENTRSHGINATTSAATSKWGAISIVNCEIAPFASNTAKAIALVGTTAADLYDITIAGCSFRTSGTARSAIQFTNVNNAVISALVLNGYNAMYSSTTSTNIVDLTASSAVSYATPAIVLGTAAGTGAASTVIRSDATIVAFDTTVPVTQALGDTAATGSAAVAARRDHKHAMPALSTATPLVESGAGSAGSAVPSSREDHVHPSASAGVGQHILLADGHATPFTFNDLLQMDDGSDFMWSDA